ncbi:hypothetical protein BpHYR1_033092, partial [Brachionus plicatilis]
MIIYNYFNKAFDMSAGLPALLLYDISFRDLPERLRSETEPVSSCRFLVEETHFADTPNNLDFRFAFYFHFLADPRSAIFEAQTLRHIFFTHFLPNQRFFGN